MLLSGIYYGKIPICKAYKKGHIIWGATEENKHFGLNPVNVNAVSVAYITQAALHELQLEYGINISSDANMVSDQSSEMVYDVSTNSKSDANINMCKTFNLGNIAMILLIDVTSVSSHALHIQNLANVDFNIDVNAHSSVTKPANNDAKVDFNINANAVVLKVEPSTVNNNISLFGDVNARTSISQATSSNEHVLLDGNVDGNASTVCVTTVDSITNIDADAMTVIVPTIDVDGCNDIAMDASADMRFSRTTRYKVNDNIVMRQHAEQNTSQTSDVKANQSIDVHAVVEQNMSPLNDVNVNKLVCMDTESELNMAIFSYHSVNHQMFATPITDIVNSNTDEISCDVNVDINKDVNVCSSDINNVAFSNDIELNSVVDLKDSNATETLLIDGINMSADTSMNASDYFTFKAHDVVHINNDINAKCSKIYALLLSGNIKSNGNSILSNGVLHAIDCVDMQCRSGCSVELSLELGWDDPVKIGNGLLIAQVFDVSPDGNTLTLI